MSFDIFVSVIMNRQEDNFDRTIVEKAFEALCDDIESEDWYLHTLRGEQTFGTVMIDTNRKIDSFSVNRPPFIPEFWNAIYEVIKQTRTILLWPGTGPHPTYCVANPDFRLTIPPVMIEDMGQPTFVSSGAEIEAVINLSA